MLFAFITGNSSLDLLKGLEHLLKGMNKRSHVTMSHDHPKYVAFALYVVSVPRFICECLVWGGYN